MRILRILSLESRALCSVIRDLTDCCTEMDALVHLLSLPVSPSGGALLLRDLFNLFSDFLFGRKGENFVSPGLAWARWWLFCLVGTCWKTEVGF